MPPQDLESKYWGQQNKNKSEKDFINNLAMTKYNLKDMTNNEPIKIFLVPHTHLDPGWLETMEFYYQKRVKIILMNVIQALSVDPKKKYTWCEVSYLQRFWEDRAINETYKYNLEL